jgi:hypothetical protein
MIRRLLREQEKRKWIRRYGNIVYLHTDDNVTRKQLEVLWVFQMARFLAYHFFFCMNGLDKKQSEVKCYNSQKCYKLICCECSDSAQPSNWKKKFRWLRVIRVGVFKRWFKF